MGEMEGKTMEDPTDMVQVYIPSTGPASYTCIIDPGSPAAAGVPFEFASAKEKLVLKRMVPTPIPRWMADRLINCNLVKAGAPPQDDVGNLEGRIQMLEQRHEKEKAEMREDFKAMLKEILGENPSNELTERIVANMLQEESTDETKVSEGPKPKKRGRPSST